MQAEQWWDCLYGKPFGRFPACSPPFDCVYGRECFGVLGAGEVGEVALSPFIKRYAAYGHCIKVLAISVCVLEPCMEYKIMRKYYLYGAIILSLLAVSARSAWAAYLTFERSLSGFGRVIEFADDPNYLYVATDGSGWRIYEKETWNWLTYVPDNPYYAGLPTYSTGLHLDGNTLYVARWEPGLFKYDVTNRSSVILLDRWPNVPTAPISDVLLYNGRLYAREWKSAYVLNPNNISAGPLDSDTWSKGLSFKLLTKGNYLFVPNYWDIRIYDISNPDDLVYVKTFGSGINGAIVGNYYIQPTQYSGDNLFRIYNISNISNITTVKTWSVGDGLAHTGTGITVRGNRMYIADRDRGIHVFDITDVTNPVRLDFIPTTMELSYGLLADDNYLYVGTGVDGELVYRITPIPEPFTILMMAGGAVMTALAARKNRKTGSKVQRFRVAK